MKLVTVRDAKTHLSACLEDSQKEGVVVTHHGRPRSVVIGVEGYDLTDVMLMLDPRFWKLIEARRRQSSSPLADFEQELALEKKKPARRHRGRMKKAG
jgi:prevent-host-death family protein